jgi:DNA-binding NarL/FixJ family response regulator
MLTRVLVAAAYPTVRAGLSAVMRAEPQIEVVGDADGAERLLGLAASLQPDVVLVEVETAEDEMIDVLWQLGGQGGGPGTVVLCDASERWVRDALRAGVRGVLARDASAGEIVAAVLAAGNGLVVLNAPTLLSVLPPEPAPARITTTARQVEALTPREVEVMRLLSEGLGNKVISRRLGISEHTVKFHVGAIMQKLGASSRTEAVTQAARRGLIML